MEPLSPIKRKIPRFEMITGMGGSFLVHALVFGAAFIAIWTMPHKPIKPPFCTVNLVSLKDIGTGNSEPRGEPKGSEDIKVPDAPKSYARVAQKPGPALPVKRLHLDEKPRSHEVPIKKIEPREAPKLPDPPQSQASVNIDKLIPKPKVVPQPKASAAASGTSAPAPAPASAEPAAARAGKGTATAGSAPRGTPTGSTDAGAKGVAQGSTAGSPEGSTAMNALVGLYGEKVKEAIQRQWRLNEQGTAGVKAVVRVQIRKNGELVSVHVVKASGNSVFDEAAVRAVQKAAPLPAVPEVMAQSNVITLMLNFVPGSVS